MSDEIIYSTKDLLEKIDSKLELIVGQIQGKADRSELEAVIATVAQNAQRIALIEERARGRDRDCIQFQERIDKTIEGLKGADRSRGRWILGTVTTFALTVLGFALTLLASSGRIP